MKESPVPNRSVRPSIKETKPRLFISWHPVSPETPVFVSFRDSATRPARYTTDAVGGSTEDKKDDGLQAPTMKSIMEKIVTADSWAPELRELMKVPQDVKKSKDIDVWRIKRLREIYDSQPDLLKDSPFMKDRIKSGKRVWEEFDPKAELGRSAKKRKSEGSGGGGAGPGKTNNKEDVIERCLNYQLDPANEKEVEELKRALEKKYRIETTGEELKKVITFSVGSREPIWVFLPWSKGREALKHAAPLNEDEEMEEPSGQGPSPTQGIISPTVKRYDWVGHGRRSSGAMTVSDELRESLRSGKRNSWDARQASEWGNGDGANEWL